MKTVEKEEKEESPEEIERQKRIERMPILEECYNLMDFEAVARTVMKKTAWAYYSSGADDEIVSPSHHLIAIANLCRLCEKITPLSTRSGSDLESSSMLRRLISQLLCWAQKLISHSTSQPQHLESSEIPRERWCLQELPRNTMSFK